MATRPTTAPTPPDESALGLLLTALAAHQLPARIGALPGFGRGVHIPACGGQVVITDATGLGIDHSTRAHAGWTARWIEHDDHGRISLTAVICSTHGTDAAADTTAFVAELVQLIAPIPNRPPLLSSRARALAHTHAARYMHPQELEALPVLHVGGLAIGVWLDAADGHAMVMVDADTADTLMGDDGRVRVRVEVAGTA